MLQRKRESPDHALGTTRTLTMLDTLTRPSPPILFERTQGVLAELEAALDQPVLTYWNSASGGIYAADVVALYGVLRRMGPRKRAALFIKSDGGSGEASLRMVNLLRDFVTDLTVLVPLECASAATMLALGADRILMGPLAQLSAVDTSLTHDLSPIDRDNDRVRVSHDELQRVVRLWQSQSGDSSTNPYAPLFQHVHPLVIGAVDRASALSTRICADILSFHLTDDIKVREISNTLNSSYPSHSYPITLREAQRIGLEASRLPEDANAILLELNELYSEMGQRAATDYDERNSHDNSITNIIEGAGLQIFFQRDKSWHYRTEERRWVPLNDRSGWKKAEAGDGGPAVSIFHVR
jgi:hypothetical protein